MNVVKLWRWLTNILMPPVEEPAVHTESDKKEEPDRGRMVDREIYDNRKASGGSFPYEPTTMASYQPKTPPLHRSSRPQTNIKQPERPHLTVHTTQIPSLNVKIYVPRVFDQVQEIADDLKAGKAVLVNYERVEQEEQRRICDFINGVCYIVNGEVKRVSTSMVLYAPDGVNVYEAEPIPLQE